MEIILNRTLILNNDPRNSRNVTKSFESNVIPRQGDYIFASAFHRDDEIKVESVVIDYEQNYCYVTLEFHHLESDDINVLKRFVDMYISHDWECGFYGFENE